jgi:hypothetical protein
MKGAGTRLIAFFKCIFLKNTNRKMIKNTTKLAKDAIFQRKDDIFGR